ncbi:hypothetical protein V5O48_008629 [Marasmius crinis-equi]|uniref:F-box domain-containing protein n=1 Tax=Marasmius crinis-equi TaxID=585013 RepID=A0ABR3FDK9_9AGAR
MLPTEIIIQIFDELHATTSGRQALCECSLVHSSWRRYVQPLLFRDLKIEGVVYTNDLERAQAVTSSFEALLESIETHPELTSYIHNLRLVRLRRVRIRYSNAQALADESKYVATLLPKLTHLQSVELNDVHYSYLSPEVRRSVRALFNLPSLLSLKMTRSSYPSAFELLVAIISASNLQNLHLSHLDFEQFMYGPPGGDDPVIPSSEMTVSRAAPHSIRLTGLHLQLSTGMNTIVHFLSAPHCPFSFECLNSLSLIRPDGNPQNFDPLFDPPSDLDHGSLSRLLQAVGSNVKHFALGYSLQGEEGTFPLLKSTPSLRSLTLSRLIHSPLSNPVSRIQDLFPPTLSTIEDIVLRIDIKEPSADEIFWSPWQSLDTFFATTSRFPSLRQVEFQPAFTYQTEWSADTKAVILAQFPILAHDKKLVVNHDVHVQ